MSKTDTVSPSQENNGPLVLEERLERLEVRPDGLYRVTVKTDHRPALSYRQKAGTEAQLPEDDAPKPLKTTNVEFVCELPQELARLLPHLQG